jgi:peroxiredoxin-like protein
MTDLNFDIHASWSGLRRQGEGRISTGGQEVVYSGPASMGGQGKGTSPEELLVSAVTACYSGTLLHVLHDRGLPAEEVLVDARGTVTGYPEQADFSRLTVNPTAVGGDPARVDEYRAAAADARDRCFIGRVVRDHLSYDVGEVRVEPSQKGAVA